MTLRAFFWLVRFGGGLKYEVRIHGVMQGDKGESNDARELTDTTRILMLHVGDVPPPTENASSELI